MSDRLRQIADAEGGELFMGWPDRWWADAHWRCEQGHVSTRVLRSEALGRDACLACRAPVRLTFPEDRDGPLTRPERRLTVSEELHPEFEKLRRHMIEEHGPILGQQAAALGAERFLRFTQGHAELQAMAMFLVMSVTATPQLGYAEDALAALEQDARDVRSAAERWATSCEELAGHWRAQREAQER